MRMRAANEDAPEHSWRGKVVDEPAFAPQQPRVLAPAQRLADEPPLDFDRFLTHPKACKRSAEDRGMGAGLCRSRFELATEVVPAVLPVHGRHDLPVPPLANCGAGHAGLYV